MEDIIIFEVQGGRLIGIDMGEWGGHIVWERSTGLHMLAQSVLRIFQGPQPPIQARHSSQQTLIHRIMKRLWEATKTSEQTVILGGCNPIAFVSSPFGVFVAEGLAHMCMNNGRLLRLERSGKTWRITGELDLEGQPRSITFIEPRYLHIGVIGNTYLGCQGKGYMIPDTVEIQVDLELFSRLY
jgi:hypothetical protein